MSVLSKRFFVLASLLSWLWLASGLMLIPAHAAVSGQTSPDTEGRQQSLPSDTPSQNDSFSTGVNQQPPAVLSPDTDSEHKQKLCESQELVVAHCEPKPGSPLSASPLVLNQQDPRLLSAV